MIAVIIFVLSALALRAEPVSYHVLRSHLIQYEGYRHSPYRDGASWSVGVGHNLTANGHKKKSYYTSREIEQFLAADLSWALDSCRKGIRDFDSLPHSVQCVAVGVAFGVGRTGFERFKGFRTALSNRSYRKAAMELQLSQWSRQVSPARANAYLKTLRALP